MTDTKSNAPSPPPPPLVCAITATTEFPIDENRLRRELHSFLDKLGERDDVFLLPPDYTRFHSKAGIITQIISEYYTCIPSSSTDASSATTRPSEFQIMPALGTHAPMTNDQINSMYGPELAKLLDTDEDPFRVHDWRRDVVTIGHVSSSMVKDATHGMVEKPWPAQVNKAVWEKRLEIHTDKSQKPLVLSIGQVVPHEVMGMANFNKNIFVGVGGLEAINLSHFIGAVYGMEKMMGKADNPLRSILNKASQDFLESQMDLWYILTVVSPSGSLQGLFIGNTLECYQKACALSMKVNFTLLEKAPKKVVVHLDRDEFHSTWLGNKAIYRTRMAIADGGELIVLAPGVKKFGEDDAIDNLIRKYGYVGTPKIMDFLKQSDSNKDDSTEEAFRNTELRENLGAVAHLIHGSTEGRFTVTYCPGYLTKAEIEGVGYRYASLESMSQKYNVDQLKDGWHKDPGNGNEEFLYISNPALGLWAVPDRFEST